MAPRLAGSDVDAAAGLADVEAEAPGLLRYMDLSDPGMHTTDTIDFEVVLEGTVVLELDDGAEVTLHPGDTVVQNGTRHRWKNAGDTVARLVVFICGASHAGVTGRLHPFLDLERSGEANLQKLGEVTRGVPGFDSHPKSGRGVSDVTGQRVDRQKSRLACHTRSRTPQCAPRHDSW